MDTTTTTISIFGMSISGLSVLSFTPDHLILLVVVIILGVLFLRMSKNFKLYTKKKTNCSTCFRIIHIEDDIRSKKVFDLQTSILREQLEHAELVISTIRTKIIELYRKEVTKYHLDPERQKDETTLYTALVDVQYERAMDWIRLRLKANHIEQKTEEEFAEYCKEVVSKLISDTRTNMEAVWTKFFSVPRSDINRKIDDLQVDFYNDIRSIFSHAQKIAKEKKEEIEKMNKEYEEKMDDLLKKAKNGDL